jgi:hypothetical protein
VALNLYIREIADYFLRENFRKISDLEKERPFLSENFTFFEITLTGNITNFRYKHNLNYTPKDVVTLHVSTSGSTVGTLTWNYKSFDATFLDLTTASWGASDTITIRAFIGRYN